MVLLRAGRSVSGAGPGSRAGHQQSNCCGWRALLRAVSLAARSSSAAPTRFHGAPLRDIPLELQRGGLGRPMAPGSRTGRSPRSSRHMGTRCNKAGKKQDPPAAIANDIASRSRSRISAPGVMDGRQGGVAPGSRKNGRADHRTGRRVACGRTHPRRVIGNRPGCRAISRPGIAGLAWIRCTRYCVVRKKKKSTFCGKKKKRGDYPASHGCWPRARPGRGSKGPLRPGGRTAVGTHLDEQVTPALPIQAGNPGSSSTPRRKNTWRVGAWRAAHAWARSAAGNQSWLPSSDRMADRDTVMGRAIPMMGHLHPGGGGATRARRNTKPRWMAIGGHGQHRGGRIPKGVGPAGLVADGR